MFLVFSKQLFSESDNLTPNSSTNIKTYKDEDVGGDDDQNKRAASLFKNAAVYEAKRASTHPMANIQGDTSTGEEHEVTKFQV